jgi:hypothetical protein
MTIYYKDTIEKFDGHYINEIIMPVAYRSPKSEDK